MFALPDDLNGSAIVGLYRIDGNASRNATVVQNLIYGRIRNMI